MAIKRLKVPPTKSTLLTLKRKVAFLEVGASLLERKRELLTRLVYERIKQYSALRKEAKAALKTAYYWLGMTHTRMGCRSLQQAALGLKPSIEVKIMQRSRIGVQYPGARIPVLMKRAVIWLIWLSCWLALVRRKRLYGVYWRSSVKRKSGLMPLNIT